MNPDLVRPSGPGHETDQRYAGKCGKKPEFGAGGFAETVGRALYGVLPASCQRDIDDAGSLGAERPCKNRDSLF